MVLGIRIIVKALILCLALVYVLTAESIESREALAVCLLEENLPYSSRKMESGFDYDVGKLVADRLELQFVPIWISNSNQILEIEGDYPFRRLSKGECSLILSVPGPEKKMGEGSSFSISLGDAYYGAAFELIRKVDNASSFSNLKGKKVAIMSQTVAHFALPKLDAIPVTYFSVKEALEGLVANEADVAVLWGPTSGWALSTYVASDREVLKKFDSLPPAGLSWNIHFATRTEDKATRERVSEALKEIRTGGELSSLMRNYHFPDRAPFKLTHTPSTFLDLR